MHVRRAGLPCRVLETTDKDRGMGGTLHSALQITSTVVFVLQIQAVWPEAIVGLSGYMNELWRAMNLGLNLNILLLVV